MPVHNESKFYFDPVWTVTNVILTSKENINQNPIKKVIFNDPATIVIWKDGTKTIVKCSEDDIYDPEKGLAMAVCKHYLTDICGVESYQYALKKWLPKDEAYATTTNEVLASLSDIWRKAFYGEVKSDGTK